MQKRPSFLLSHLASATLFAAAATALAAAPAGAAERFGESFSRSCVGSGASVTCTGSYGDRGGNAHVIGVARASDEDAQRISQDREKRWVAYCAPDIVHDRYGVGRYVYAVRGCEFGRYKD